MEKGGMVERLLSLKFVTHILHISYNLAQIYLTYRNSKKHINHMTHPLTFADITIFLWKSVNFCYIKKYRYRLHFDASFSVVSTLFEYLEIVLTNMITILMMISAKMTTPNFLKTQIFWNKGCDVIISAHDVTNKIL